MKTRLDSVNLLYYMSPISLGLLLPAMWASELDPISTYWETYIQSNVVPILIISGCIALALSAYTTAKARVCARVLVNLTPVCGYRRHDLPCYQQHIRLNLHSHRKH
jgi:hypothetical protein